MISPARVEQLDSLPPAQPWRWLDLRCYLRAGSPLPVQSKRGCAFECVHCTYRLIEGGEYRLRSPEAVAAEIEEGKRREVRRFEFVDWTFNHPPAHALMLCEAIARRELGVELQTTGLNPGAVSLELLQLMRRAGFRSAVCTPDSGSKRMLEVLRKGFGLDEAARTAAYARQAGLSILWSFVSGGPGECEATVKESLRLMEGALGPQDRIMCTLGLRIYPGTELERIARTEGALRPQADLLEPTFYFSRQVSPKRVLDMLESSRLRPQMLYLEELQHRSLGWALRLHTALRLPGVPWAALPVYNRLARWVGGEGRRFSRAD